MQRRLLPTSSWPELSFVRGYQMRRSVRRQSTWWAWTVWSEGLVCKETADVWAKLASFQCGWYSCSLCWDFLYLCLLRVADNLLRLTTKDSKAGVMRVIEEKTSTETQASCLRDVVCLFPLVGFGFIYLKPLGWEPTLVLFLLAATRC